MLLTIVHNFPASSRMKGVGLCSRSLHVHSKDNVMNIQYLEVVTTDVDAVCSLYARLHGIEFSEADPSLGGARTATMGDGGLVGVRGPLREDEEPTVRTYTLVDDIQVAVEEAAKLDAIVAIESMEIPGHGTCAIVIQGGIEFGLWQR